MVWNLELAQKADVNHRLELALNMKRAHFFDLATEATIV